MGRFGVWRREEGRGLRMRRVSGRVSGFLPAGEKGKVDRCRDGWGSEEKERGKQEEMMEEREERSREEEKM